MPKLILSRDLYDADALDSWIRRRRHALRFPREAAQLARLLKRKARARGRRTSRFFGEAYVACNLKYREIHYGSVKWLTNPRFVRTRRLTDPDHERFRRALHDNFGRDRIEKLQSAAHALLSSCRHELAGKAPTAPDLWLIDKRGRHRFIEVKLPGDSVAPHQIAGMAAISCLLNGPKRVSVEVLHLHDGDRTFKRFCRAIRAA
jgi:hypothetical protein